MTAPMAAPSSLRWADAPLHHVDTGNAVLAYRRFGTGPALLLVHGFPLHGFTWRKVLPALAQRFTCYAVDLAGMGDSNWTAATDFTFTGHARNLQILVDRLALPRYAVIAQDTGATVARCLARIDGKRLERLVMINTEIPGHRPPWIPMYQAVMQLPGAGLVLRQLLRSRWYRRSSAGFGGCFSDLSLLDGEFHDAFVAPCIASARRTEGLRRYLVGLHWDVVDAMAQWHGELRMPTLFIWGEEDPTFPVARARTMVPQLPDCRGFVTIPGACLLPHEEQPDAVSRAAAAFLAS